MRRRGTLDAMYVAALRGLGWLAVALCVIGAANGVTGPGGARVGLILAGLLAWRLRATRTGRRNR